MIDRCTRGGLRLGEKGGRPSGRRIVVLSLAVCVLLPGAGLLADSVLDSPHNLSITGPGTVKSATEEEVCVFCHTPHNARTVAPLWNREDPTSSYLSYTSDTIDATVGAPNGNSLLCLSCHDGTIALGAVLSRPQEIAMAGGQRFISGRAEIGTDLRDDHPISFVYDDAATQDAGLLPTAALPSHTPLDGSGQLQCTSCHDPHDNQAGDFLRIENIGGSLCTSCHAPVGWLGSVHQSSTATWTGAGTDPWPFTPWNTVTENACESCHQVHLAGSGPHLLASAMEEENCLVCHSGSVAEHDLEAAFSQPYRHPITQSTGVHSPAEDLLSMPRHVECVDCHDPHHAEAGGSLAPPLVPPSLAGVAGISASGTPVDPVTNGYEVCFGCHADTASPNLLIPRLVPSGNTRDEFALGNPSFHPVVGPRNSAEVPSLKTGLNPGTVMECGDCHGNPDGQALGGTGPDGPHGSPFPWILSGRYETNLPTNESPSTYELCYRCHDRSSIMNDESFGEHGKHLDEDVPCSACHDPHGVSAAQAAGSASDHTHLINFDLSVVQPLPGNGQLKFEDLGTFHGSCTLRCHGENHNGESY